MQTELEKLVSLYRELGIDRQIDYDKFYLYSLITHSTAIEGSTITELENQIMFDQGISLKGKSIVEQHPAMVSALSIRPETMRSFNMSLKMPFLFK